MNINLIYEGKNYNFDIPNNVTIDYLKELSSKIFNSEKELLDLIYNNRKISDNSDNTLIRDLIPEGESNAILTVQINKNLSNNNHKKKKERKISFEHLKERNNKENIKTVEKNSKLNDRYDKYDNEKENHKEKKMIKINPKTDESTSSKNEKLLLENIYNNNIQSKIRLMLTNNNRLNYKENKKEKFNNEYIQKNGELLSLIRQFSDKIKKIYLILYNKYKISNKNLSHNTSTLSNVKTTRNENINNNLLDNSFYELALYEKKIMNYLEIQIQHYKLLLDTIKNYDNNINFTKLSDFYHKLFMFIPEDTIINKEQKIKELMKRNKKLNNNNSSINLTSFNSNNNKKLPAIKIKNYKSPILKETKKEKLIKEIKMNSNININNNNINEFNNNFKQNELKESKLKKNNKINIEEEDNISLSNNNTNYKNNNILDNISEKNSIESNTDLNENLNNISNVSPIHLKQKNSNRIILEKNEIDNTPVKEIKLFQRKDTGTTNVSKFKNSLEKKVTLDLDANQNKKDKKVKEINTNSMTVKDSNFALEKNYNIKNKKNSINKYDYVM